MQIHSPSSTPLTSACDTSSTSQVHPETVDTPVEAVVPPANTPVTALDASVGPPSVPATDPIGVPATTADREPAFGLDTFVTKATPGAMLTAQGVFAVFSCPKDYGYDLVTERLEYNRVTRAPWDERDEFIKKRTISTEIYETSSVTAHDLPVWALELEDSAPSSTIEGGADILAQPGVGKTSAVNTPVRATSVESITTPGRDDGSSSSDGFYFTKNASLEPVSGHATASCVGNVDVPSAADTPGTVSALPKTPASTPGLLHLMGPKPVLNSNLDKTEKRQALINHFFHDQIKISDVLAQAYTATERSPTKSPTKMATSTNNDSFSAFTPNTSRFFQECEHFHDALMALPSLTPLFEAAFPHTPCEGAVVAGMSAPNTLAPHIPSANAAGPSTAVALASTSRLTPFKKVPSTSGSIGSSARSTSSSRKRTVHEISDDDEVQIVATTSRTMTKAKGKAKPKVSADSKKQKKQKGA